jgi:hypothetical protein
MRLRHSILLLSFVILAACGSDQGNEPGGEDSLGAQSPALESPIEVHRGLYAWGHDMNEFRPCDSALAYWITGPQRLVERLKMKYSQVAMRPYDVVYAELEGRIVQGPGGGDAPSEYPGRFQLSEILMVRARLEGECLTRE